MTASAFRVIAPGPLTVVVDAGRPGQARWGVAPSGPFDPAALDVANAALGNPLAAAGLEVLLGPLVLSPTRAMLFALAGPASAAVGALAVDPSRPVAVPAGGRLTVRTARGARAWLGVAGGIDARPVLGSRCTDTLAGLGPPPLAAGDVVPVGPAQFARGLRPTARGLRPTARGVRPTAPGGEGPDVVVVPLEPPPRPEIVDDATRAGLLAAFWTVSARSNRVAVRFEGAPIPAPSALAPSEGLVRGAVQLPPAGLPLVFGPDHPLTGGYPVIGVVARADLLAQLLPGQRARFVPA